MKMRAVLWFCCFGLLSACAGEPGPVVTPRDQRRQQIGRHRHPVLDAFSLQPRPARLEGGGHRRRQALSRLGPRRPGLFRAGDQEAWEIATTSTADARGRSSRSSTTVPARAFSGRSRAGAEDADNSSLPPSQRRKPQGGGARASAGVGAGRVARARPEPDAGARGPCRLPPALPGDLARRRRRAPRELDHQLDIPPIRPEVTRVTLMGGSCPHRARRFKAAPPADMAPGSPFGANARALAPNPRQPEHRPRAAARGVPRRLRGEDQPGRARQRHPGRPAAQAAHGRLFPKPAELAGRCMIGGGDAPKRNGGGASTAAVIQDQ